MTPTDSPIPHLFRTEYRKIVSVLCRRFGLDRIGAAEDIASDTFLVATQVWGIEGLPPNPTGWLYQTAKNKAKNYLARQTIFEEKVVPEIYSEFQKASTIEIDLSPQSITDSQLQMMFAICHPAIPGEAQVGLALRILCGFGIGEIADAFGTSKEVINKRLTRAREKLREHNMPVGLPPEMELCDRLNNVLLTIYLLFNEGYYSVSQNRMLRKELCYEAMRLCAMLIENPLTNMPAVNALLALMCFHASRFDARIDAQGGLVLYEDQDVDKWNNGLITRGMLFLNRSSVGKSLTRYHLEAGIAYWHTKPDETEGKWQQILYYFDRLVELQPSPIVMLNRVYAIFKVRGAQDALAEVDKCVFPHNHLYFALLGELYKEIDPLTSKQNYTRAIGLGRTDVEKDAIRRRAESRFPQTFFNSSKT